MSGTVLPAFDLKSSAPTNSYKLIIQQTKLYITNFEKLYKSWGCKFVFLNFIKE